MSAYAYNPVDIANLAAERMRALGMNVYAPGEASGMSSLSGSGTMGIADYLSGRNSTGRTMFNRQLAAGDLGALQLAQSTAAIPYPSRQGDAYEKAVQNWTQAYGLGLNSPFVAKYFNGSAIDLGVGLQSMALAGTRINGKQAYGGGPYTDAVALDLYNNVQKNFFSGPLGMGTQRAFGFDKTEFGQMFSALGQRGAFAGIVDSTVNIGESGATVTHSAGSIEKLNSKISEAARSLGLLKDIFGATKNIAQLVNIAENVGGIDFADPKAFQNLQARVVRTTTRALSMGMDPRATLEYEAALAETYRGMGYSTMGAGALSGITMDAAQRRYSAYRESRKASDNVYLPNVDLPAFVGVQTNLQNQMINHPESHAALLALDLMQSGSVSKTDAAALRAAMSDTSDAGIENLRTKLYGMGYDVGSSIMARGGAQAVFSNLNTASATAMGNYNDAVLGRRSTSDLVTSILRTMSPGNMAEDKLADAGEMVKQMKTTLTSANQVRVAEVLRNGGTREELMQILTTDASGMGPAAAGNMADSLMSLGSNFGTYFNQFNRIYATSGGSANSAGDRNVSAAGQLAAMRVYENLTPTGKPIAQLVAGMLGSQTLSQDAVMAVLAKDAKTIDVSDITKVSDADLTKLVGEEGAAEIRTRINNLGKAGNTDSKDAIMNELMIRNQLNGGISGRFENKDASGKVVSSGYKLAAGEDVDRVQRSGVAQMLIDYERTVALTPENESEEDRSARAAAIRAFSEKYKDGAPDPVGQKIQYEAYMKERAALTGEADFSKVVVASALRGDESDQARLKDAFGYNKSLTQKALQDEIEKKKAALAEAPEEKKGDLRKAINKLEEAKASGTNDYLGVLKLKIGDNFLVDLFKMLTEGKQ